MNTIKPARGAEEVLRLLSQLMAMRGLVTDPDIPGTEKIVVSRARDQWVNKINLVMPATFDAEPSLLPPNHVFAVKGWNRSIAAHLFLLACWDTPALLEERLQ